MGVGWLVESPSWGGGGEKIPEQGGMIITSFYKIVHVVYSCLYFLGERKGVGGYGRTLYRDNVGLYSSLIYKPWSLPLCLFSAVMSNLQKQLYEVNKESAEIYSLLILHSLQDYSRYSSTFLQLRPRRHIKSCLRSVCRCLGNIWRVFQRQLWTDGSGTVTIVS